MGTVDVRTETVTATMNNTHRAIEIALFFCSVCYNEKKANRMVTNGTTLS